MTIANHGPECANGMPLDVMDGCLAARVHDSTGAVVYVQPVMCLAPLLLGPVPIDWSRSSTLSWDQTTCASPQVCPGEPVPAGTYTIDTDVQ